MKFGQVRKYNMRNIFIEKSNTKCAGEPIPISYSKKLKLHDHFLKNIFLIKLFFLHDQNNQGKSLKILRT